MIYKFENPTIPSAKILRNTTKTFPRFLQPNLSTYYSHTRNPILSTEFKLPTLFGNNFSQLDQVLTNRGSFPRRTKLTRVRRSSHVLSELLAFLAFLKVHERARARTRTRSRDPGLLWTRIAWPLSGNSHSPKRKLIHHARIPPVISGRVTNYSSPSSHHGRPSSCRDRSPSLPPPPSSPFRKISHKIPHFFCLYIFFRIVTSRSCFRNNPLDNHHLWLVEDQPVSHPYCIVPLGHWSRRRRVALPATTFSRQSARTLHWLVRDGKGKQVFIYSFFFFIR